MIKKKYYPKAETYVVVLADDGTEEYYIPPAHLGGLKVSAMSRTVSTISGGDRPLIRGFLSASREADSHLINVSRFKRFKEKSLDVPLSISALIDELDGLDSTEENEQRIIELHKELDAFFSVH